MTGTDLKRWMKENSVKPEQLCVILECSVDTLRNWYRENSLKNRTVLALAQLGCPQAKEELKEAFPRLTSFGK